MKTIELSNKKPLPLENFSQINKKLLFSKPENVLICNGYYNYLALAWKNHYGIKIQPDDIWHIILSELTLIISKNPKTFAGLFTNQPDKKQLILVPTQDPEVIRPELIINKLKHLVPIDTDIFLPKFTTTTERITLARHVSFCDIVSPYYSYGMFLCDIPKVIIEGTIQDWELLYKNLLSISKIFTGKTNNYLLRCLKLIEQFINYTLGINSEDFFKKMVKLERCGSGSQYEMSGWFIDFLYEPKKKIQLEGLPPQISKMKYKNITTNKDYEMYAGILYCAVDESWLVPEYNAYVTESKE